MFDFAWSEIALIGVVALVLIGPKDMPVAIRAVSNVIKKARRMAGEFQTHVDEMVREANLDEVRSQIQEIRNFDIRGEVEKAVDADGSIRGSFASQPFDPWKDGTNSPTSTTTVASAAAGGTGETPDAKPAPPEEAPAFVPPEIVAAHAPAPAPVVQPPPPEAPAFIPPGVTSPDKLRA
jgi:sec-independent protein translocase protein TatB